MEVRPSGNETGRAGEEEEEEEAQSPSFDESGQINGRNRIRATE